MEQGGLIILEGPDGGGKSTLARALVLHYHHSRPGSRIIRGSERGWGHADYDRALREAWLCTSQGGVAIMDRCHWSDDAYGAFDRSPDAGEVEYEKLDDYIEERFPWWIGFLCLPSLPYSEVQDLEERVNLLSVRSQYVELLLAACPEKRIERGYITTWDYTVQDETDVILLVENAKFRSARRGFLEAI